MATDLNELSDEDIQARLNGEATSGPVRFRGKELAKFSRGLRDLVLKVVNPEDTMPFHDLTLLFILSEAHDPDPQVRLHKRAALIAATDDVHGFRAAVSIEFIDELSDEEAVEARRIARQILEPAELARVDVVPPPGQKKSAAVGKVTPSRTTTPSQSSSSRQSPGGRRARSAGN